MSKLSVCLWFNGHAEDAANTWVRIFREAAQEASSAPMTGHEETLTAAIASPHDKGGYHAAS